MTPLALGLAGVDQMRNRWIETECLMTNRTTKQGAKVLSYIGSSRAFRIGVCTEGVPEVVYATVA